MPTTTPNFGWSVPVSTDLVKDGATAIELLGDSVDASLVDLKGGTTGQLLSKASNADMDFIFVSPNPGDITGVAAGIGISGGGTSGDVTVTNSMATAIDAKGDLIGGTGADAFARLAVGANDTVLTADSSTATGLKWAAPAGAGVAYTLVSTTRMLSLGGTVTFSSLGSFNNIFVTIETLATNGTDSTLYLRCNGSTTTSHYTQNYIRFTNSSSFSTAFMSSGADQAGNSNGNPVAYYGTTSSPTISGYFKIEGAKASTPKLIPFAAGASSNASSPQTYIGCSQFNGSAITSFTLSLSSGSFNDGFIRIYGSTI